MNENVSLPADVTAYLNKQEGDQKIVATALAERIQTLGNELTHKLAWGFPCWSGNERVLSIVVHKNHCNLQLWYGARLNPKFPDRIEGTGKAARHVKVRNLADFDDELDAVILASIETDRTDPEKVR